jgi:hypothetical protein
MNTNPSDPAFPHPAGQVSVGLTKREYFAGLAMQAWLTNDPSEPDDKIGEWSVKAADALIVALNYPQPPQPPQS